jgi:hypothetical protein
VGGEAIMGHALNLLVDVGVMLLATLVCMGFCTAICLTIRLTLRGKILPKKKYEEE